MFGDRWSMKVVSLTTGDMALDSRPEVPRGYYYVT